jgi:hypothetical protein
MQNLTVTVRGFERSALVKRGDNIVAEVFTDYEPGDQHRTAALIAAAPLLLAALQAIVAQVDAPGATVRSITGDRIAAARAAIARAAL